MSGINKVFLVGHIGKDLELRKLTNDVAVVNFPLATTEILNKNGQQTEVTEWHNVVLWRGLAESASKLLRKGSLVYLEGKVRTRSFIDKDGLKKYTAEIIAEQFKLLSRPGDFNNITGKPS